MEDCNKHENCQKIDILLDITREAKVKQEKLIDDIQEIKDVLAKQSVQVELNRIGLDEHMEQTKLIREEVQLNKKDTDKRLDDLETPVKAKEMIYNWLLRIGAVAGVLVGVYEAFKMFTK